MVTNIFKITINNYSNSSKVIKIFLDSDLSLEEFFQIVFFLFTQSPKSFSTFRKIINLILKYSMELIKK